MILELWFEIKKQTTNYSIREDSDSKQLIDDIILGEECEEIVAGNPMLRVIGSAGFSVNRM